MVYAKGLPSEGDNASLTVPFGEADHVKILGESSTELSTGSRASSGNDEMELNIWSGSRDSGKTTLTQRDNCKICRGAAILINAYQSRSTIVGFVENLEHHQFVLSITLCKTSFCSHLLSLFSWLVSFDCLERTIQWGHDSHSRF